MPAGRVYEVRYLLDRMEQGPTAPTAETYDLAVQACCVGENYPSAWKLVQDMRASVCRMHSFGRLPTPWRPSSGGSW